MPDHTPRNARHASHDAGNERRRIDAIFADFLGKYRTSQGTTVLPPPPTPKRQPRTLPTPEPWWRYIRVNHPPQISDARWDSLSRSQVRALRLLRRGQEQAALETLRSGTWHNPDEELRELLIYLHRRPRRTVPAAANPEEATS